MQIALSNFAKAVKYGNFPVFHERCFNNHMVNYSENWTQNSNGLVQKRNRLYISRGKIMLENTV